MLRDDVARACLHPARRRKIAMASVLVTAAVLMNTDVAGLLDAAGPLRSVLAMLIPDAVSSEV